MCVCVHWLYSNNYKVIAGIWLSEEYLCLTLFEHSFTCAQAHTIKSESSSAQLQTYFDSFSDPPFKPENITVMYSSKSISLTLDIVKTGDSTDEDAEWSIVYDWR